MTLTATTVSASIYANNFSDTAPLRLSQCLPSHTRGPRLGHDTKCSRLQGHAWLAAFASGLIDIATVVTADHSTRTMLTKLSVGHTCSEVNGPTTSFVAVNSPGEHYRFRYPYYVCTCPVLLVTRERIRFIRCPC